MGYLLEQNCAILIFKSSSAGIKNLIFSTLLALAFLGVVGFDDRLQSIKAPRASFKLPFLKTALCGSAVIGSTFFCAHYCLFDSVPFVLLSGVVPSSALLRAEGSALIWRKRNSENQHDKKRISKQNGRLAEKLYVERTNSSLYLAELAQAKESLLAQAKRFAVKESKHAEMIERTQSQLSEAQTSLAEVMIERVENNHFKEAVGSAIENSNFTRKERSPYPLELMRNFVYVSLGAVAIRPMVRTLERLNTVGMLDFRIPSRTSIGNWTFRAGLGLLKGIKAIDEPYVVIVDHCKALGNIKVFVALALTLSDYEASLKEERALTLADLTVVEIIPMATSNGLEMAAVYKSIFTKLGSSPAYILSDKGSDLMSGIRIYRAVHDDKVEFLHDFSHMASNLFKAEYEHTEWLKEFTALKHSGSASLRQGLFAHLAGPAIRTKAKFMNMKKTLQWAMDICQLTEGRGRAEGNSEKAALRTAFPGIRKFKPQIAAFLKACILVEKCAKLLKEKGYSSETEKQCLKWIQECDTTPQNIRDGLIAWLSSARTLKMRLIKKGWTAALPISSDPIESLFSRYKNMLSHMPMPEPTRRVLTLPLLCGRHSEEKIEQAMGSITMKCLNDWDQKNIPKTQIKKRKELKKRLALGKEKTAESNKTVDNFKHQPAAFQDFQPPF